MRRIAFFVLGAVALSTSALAQTPAATDPALLAAPANLREGATIIKWKPDYTYDTVKKGTNRLVCFDLSGMAGQVAFSIECTSIANLDRVAQNLKFEAEPDKAIRKTALDAAEKNGTRAKPEFGSVWFHLRGPDRERARPHATIAVPGATTASLGVPEDAKQGGVWIMDAGTSTAHLMTPGQ